MSVWIIKGRFVFGYTDTIPSESPLESELHALLLGIRKHKEMGLGKICFCSDSLEAIQTIKLAVEGPWFFNTTFEDLIKASNNPNCTFLQIPRSLNIVPHMIAKLATMGHLAHDWTTALASSFKDLFPDLWKDFDW